MRYSATAQKLGNEAAVNRLRDKLLRVMKSCDALREEKSAPSQDYAALIERLSREIDETVLPRKFALISDAGIEATLVVSNRRLIELEICGRKIEFDAEADTDADTVARACAKALRALSLQCGLLHLRTIERASKVTTKGTTCAARHLMQYSRPSHLQNRLKAFLQATHASSMGWIYHSGDGQTMKHGPDEGIVQDLDKLHQRVISQANDRERVRRVERAGPTCSAFAMTADAQVLVAEDGNDRLLAVFPVSDLTKVMTNWHQVFRRPEP